MGTNKETEPAKVAETVAPVTATDDSKIIDEPSDISFDGLLENSATVVPDDRAITGLHGHIKNNVEEEEREDYFLSLSDAEQAQLAKRFPSQYSGLMPQQIIRADDIEQKIEKKMEIRNKLKTICADNGLTAKAKSDVVKLYNQYLEQNGDPNAAYQRVLGALFEKGVTPKSKIEEAEKNARKKVANETPSGSAVQTSAQLLSVEAYDGLDYSAKKNYKALLKETYGDSRLKFK